MPDVSNTVIADALEELGDLYELDGAIVHRVLAYRRAAQSVRESARSVGGLAQAGRATELAGIGATLQEKILALVQTGAIPAAERLREQFPPGLLALTRLPGVGAKRARLLQRELGIDSLQALREAALAQRLRTVKGLGPKFETSVLAALDELAAESDGEENELPRRATRLLLPAALELGAALTEGLHTQGPTDADVRIAGSARRGADAVKDLDLVAVTEHPQELTQALGRLDEIERVASTSVAGARGRTHSGVAIDLRIATPAQLGNLLQHFTGSAAHNATLRTRAVRAGLHVSEYGVLDDADGASRMCATEAEVYELLGLPWIAPELREDRGELEAAARGELPRLIELGDIRGDLHCHTVASDGRATIAEMARAARDRGYEYLAITDHSASHGFGNGVSPGELAAQIERIAELDARLEGIELLAGSEVNILPDGSLDYADELLARLDWVVASVHTAFGMSQERMTERMIAAIEHPLVDAIGHPTGRLIQRREPYAVDLAAIFAAAARTGTLLEINGNPDRRDLCETHARAAAAAGARLVIDSDAHRTQTVANMRWGVLTARRAWLTPADVANTLPWPELARRRKRTTPRGATPRS
ncbi:MAG TPA: DNA polymerase/3'-5' exonuclease PolX [Solirubrobacteraceae bacterium]|nr:DNA polymerase/3'-5' exonuclease PolX [Solirubrobacteraceae bacterium]